MSRTAQRTTASASTGAPARPGAAAAARARLLIVGLAAGLGVSSVVTIGIGPVAIAPETVARIVAHHALGIGVADWSAADDNIVWLLRTPRMLLGAAVGAALAVAGVAVQALVRNPLADPYLLGMSSGASTGAAASILFGVGSGLGAASLTGSAFVGAVLATALVFTIARLGGSLSPARLIFAGIAVGFALNAVTNLLVFASDSREGARAVLFWSLGSLGQARWQSVPIVLVAVPLVTAVLMLWARQLDAMAIGDDTARSMGTDPVALRRNATLLACLTVAAAVAVSGAIGFVGLVVPHLARSLVGGLHRRVLPVAALLGGLLLLWADAFARTAFEPRELPLGVLTALIGTPLLVALVARTARR